jgi:hypothetical protein
LIVTWKPPYEYICRCSKFKFTLFSCLNIVSGWSQERLVEEVRGQLFALFSTVHEQAQLHRICNIFNYVVFLYFSAFLPMSHIKKNVKWRYRWVSYAISNLTIASTCVQTPSGQVVVSLCKKRYTNCSVLSGSGNGFVRLSIYL